MNILIKRKTRQPLLINTEEELTLELKKVSKNFKQINDLNRHLFACLHSAVFLKPSEFYAKLRKLLGNYGSGMKATNVHSLTAVYGWEQKDAEEWGVRYGTRTIRHLEKTEKDRDQFYRQRSHFSIDFWLKRGLTLENAKIKISQIQTEQSAKLTREARRKNSHFSLDYTGYEKKSKDEKVKIISDLQKKMSPRCKEFWINKGFSDTESSALVTSYQRSWMEGKTEEQLSEINKRKTSNMSFQTLWSNMADRSGHIYIIEIEENICKIGITTRGSVKNRYCKEVLEKAKIILESPLDRINTAFFLEQLILRKNQEKRLFKKYGDFGKNEILKISSNELKAQVNFYLENTQLIESELFPLINKNNKIITN